MSKATKYRELELDDLDTRIGELRQSLFNLRVRNTTKELENTSQLRHERRELARVMSLRTQKLASQNR